MTILENEPDAPKRNKLTLNKRKHPGNDQEAVSKKQAMMINGYRSDMRSNGDGIEKFPVATLSNMGNTCFLNSVLYTLRFAPTFLHNLHHLTNDLAVVGLRMKQNKAKTSSLGRNVNSMAGTNSRSTSSKDLLAISDLPKTKVQIVTEKLHELFVVMHNLESKDVSESYQPISLLQAIREANYIFEGNHQQDAHELLVYLLDNIRETCDLLSQQVQQNPKILEDADTGLPANSKWSWKRSYKKKNNNKKEAISEENVNGTSSFSEDAGNSSETFGKRLGYNFVAEDFEGITLRRTKCLECESVTERKEPFYDIPVPIALKEDEFDEKLSASEIYKKACVTTEKLCESNKYLCEKCVRHNEASREVLFEKLPNIMVLQLKRFTTGSGGIQKVNTYLPTPLELECFCESCCKVEDIVRPHRYQLCCIIMHLGGTMASGHYISYVKASEFGDDYFDCGRDTPKTSLSASSSEKSLNLLKYLKPKGLGLGLINGKNGLTSKNVLNGMRVCKSVDCCGVRMNADNVLSAISKKSEYREEYQTKQVWLECDDENIKPITLQELNELLSYKQNSTSTPYLLFYSKIG